MILRVVKDDRAVWNCYYSIKLEARDPVSLVVIEPDSLVRDGLRIYIAVAAIGLLFVTKRGNAPTLLLTFFVFMVTVALVATF